MFINDANKKEEIRNIAIQDLKRLGIKYRSKKSRQHVQEAKRRKVFKVPLQCLPMETVTLPSGQQLVVPKIVHELCSYLVLKIDTEGLFRKGGSKARQNEIKLSLDAGCYLGDEHHEIDVASVLKTFFRELPEPLIPYSHHELFLRCMLLADRQRDAVLLSCLLLPMEHLNTLAYFMQFLLRVSEYQQFNKMDAYNLAVVIGPTLLPAEEKTAIVANHRLTKTCELFKLLIENAGDIGILSEDIIERIAVCNTSHAEEDSLSLKKKKKRRSGSLTRMLSGLKKIVGNKSEEAPAPDLLQTPCLTRSAKKRKIEAAGLSAKKRREILNNLPQNAILNTPYAPTRTPVNTHPNIRKKCTPEIGEKAQTKPENTKEKRLLWSSRSKPSKKQNDETSSIKSTSSIQRRWSAVSSVAGFRKKKRTSCAGSLAIEEAKSKDPQVDNRINVLSEELNKKQNEPDYVRISKVEYEEIKNRVSAIERRISVELETNTVDNVEKAYEKTLVQAEPMSPTTDQLAKRLSKELKIRRSCENKVFRSPSARKIGSLRRRSKEGQVRLVRTQTWCVTSVPRASPVLTDSSQNSPALSVSRSASSLQVSGNLSTSWKSAQGFFGTPDVSSPSIESCRASLAKLRSQNAGMVLAKARLFDNLVDTVEPPKIKTKVKVGNVRNLDNRQSYRMRTLRLEDRRMVKKGTPRRKSAKSPRIQKTPKYNEGQAENILMPATPNIPQIKKALNPKTPRRICQTPGNGDLKQTPLKVISRTGGY